MYSNLSTFEVEKEHHYLGSVLHPPPHLRLFHQYKTPPPSNNIDYHTPTPFIVAREGFETPNRMIRSQTPSHLANVLLVNLQAV